MQIQQIPNTNYITKLNNQRSQYSNRPAFTGVAASATDVAKGQSKFFEPVKNFFAPLTNAWSNGMDKLETGMAKGFAKLLETNPAERFINKAKKGDVVKHLSAFIGVVLSGFYIKKTLENKQLDEQKRKTLAINQASVCALSTLGAYTVSKFADKRINMFKDKFIKTNVKADIQDLVKYENGIKTASSLMIFGMMYRFIAPVLVTPIANYLGDKLHEKNNSKLAEAKNQ